MNKLYIIALSFCLLPIYSVFAQQDSTQKSTTSLVNMAFEKLDQQRIVGAVDVIKGEELMHSNEYSPNAALSGLASGLFANKSAAGPGYNYSSLRVRGLSRGSNGDDPLFVIDGIPNRSLSDLTTEAIESITILKDVTAKMLYGSQAANGVILITTKRGSDAPRELSFSAEAGVRLPTATAQFLNAAEYASKYNEAAINDGLTAPYSSDDIKKYTNGSSPLTHPDMDYNETFLKNMSDYERVNAILQGGDEQTKYFINLEYIHESGLEKTRNNRHFNQLNLVNNLNFKVNDIISAGIDMVTRLGLHNNSRVEDASLFSKISSQRPNDYPFFVTQDQSVNLDSLAYNTLGTSNLYGDIHRNGYYYGQDFMSQNTFTLDFNFEEYVKGLSADVLVGFDSYNSIYQGKTLNYATYRIMDDGTLTRIGKDELKPEEQRLADDFMRNIAGTAKIDYIRSFGKHDLSSNLNYSLRQLSYKTLSTYDDGVKQDLKGVNLGFSANYAYDNKYIIQLTGSYMGSDKFVEGSRYKPYGAIGAGWILSNESFMSSVDVIDFLKLKASFGVMGYDWQTDYYLERNEYDGVGAYYFGTNNTETSYTSRMSQIGNPNITFEEAQEMNIGLEARLLKNKLNFEVNYFDQIRSGIPIVPSGSVPAFASQISAMINYNEVHNSGIDLDLNYSDVVGDLEYSIGGNFMYAKAVYNAYDENIIYSHQSNVGEPVDLYRGLVAESTWATQAAIDNSGIQSAYGTIAPGDLKYEDYIQDGGIDEYDMQAIGNWYPRINYGVNIDVKYKGFELYLLGQGVASVDKMLSNSYYWNLGEQKYSEYVNTSDYPRLTTSPNGHSYVNSTYWLTDGSFFKLRTAELSYMLSNKVSKNIRAEGIKLFVRGTDLLSISKIPDLDPEDLNAGITKYPMFTTVSLGAKVTF